MSLTSISAIRMNSDYSLVGYSRQTDGVGTADREIQQSEDKSDTAKANANKATGSLDNLTPAQLKELDRLQKRDREVRDHEMAHMAAGGQYVNGGASYQYQRGPDGRRYAVEGEVRIDMSEVPGDPEATAKKMRAVKRAALAPAVPSSQDRMVATKAGRIENEMQLELLQLKLNQAESEYRKASALDPAESSRSAHHPETGSQPGAALHIIG